MDFAAFTRFMAALRRQLGDKSVELIYDGRCDRPNLTNGRPLNYEGCVRERHRNHVHWAAPLN